MHKIPFLRVVGKQALFVLPVEAGAGNGGEDGNSRVSKVHAVDKPAQIAKILSAEADVHNKQAHRMNGKLPKEADAGAVDIEGGSLGVAVKLPVADGLQTYHNIFQADIGQGLHKLPVFRDKIGSSVADKGFVNVVAADEGDEFPKPVCVIEEIIVHDLNVGTCNPQDLLNDQGEIPLVIPTLVQGPSIAEGAVMGTGGAGL